MKWLIASDIHGSAKWCRELIHAYEKEKADRILLLGDLLYHGPRNALPEEYDTFEVTRLLNSVKDVTTAVRGNCDADIDQVLLEFPMMADYAFLMAGEKTVFVTHGHLFNKESLPPLHSGDILMNGHFHVPACEDCGSFYYLNPGSVSIPKEDSDHSYMIFEDRTFLWKTFDGKSYMQWTF